MPMPRKNKTEKIVIRCTIQTKKAWDELRFRLNKVAEDLFVDMMEHYKRTKLLMI